MEPKEGINCTKAELFIRPFSFLWKTKQFYVKFKQSSDKDIT